jgi:alpha-methylacyl-CoA racemase
VSDEGGGPPVDGSPGASRPDPAPAHPAPAHLLADLGCDVVTAATPAQAAAVPDRPATNPLTRGKRSVTVDLKAAGGADAVLALCDRADVLVDPFRPGVCERLGIGPDVVCGRNERLVYARLTGWGQDGPYADRVGHDIDYLAVAGALALLGSDPDGEPTVPLNLIADFAGGGMLLVVAVAAALVERARSGRGQVVDVAMVDGVAALVGPFYSARASGAWGPRGTNLLDGGAHFYASYRTSDDRWLAVGAIEPRFYASLLEVLGLADDPTQWDRSGWPSWKQRLADVFASATRDEWVARFAGTEACVAPVLDPAEVAHDPHVVARGTVVEVDGVPQPGAAPRFGRTPGSVGEAVHPGAHSLDDVLGTWS